MSNSRTLSSEKVSYRANAAAKQASAFRNQSPELEILKDRRVVAVIPAYNEARFIGSVVLQVLESVATIIVVDDGSTDATAAIAEAAGAHVVSHDTNQGKGVALNTALDATRSYDPEVVILLDADGQHCPEDLPVVVTPILEGHADLVIGSRYIENNSHVPTSRVWGHRVFNLLTRLASGSPSSDSQSGFRALSPTILDQVRFKSDGFSVESEMQFIASQHDLRLEEVPITIRYTDRPKRSLATHGLGVLNGILRLVGQYRPLLFFGLTGMVFIFAGFGMSIYVVDIYRRVRTLAVGYTLISIFLTIVGMMSLSTGIILHSVRGLLLDMLRTKDGKLFSRE